MGIDFHQNRPRMKADMADDHRFNWALSAHIRQIRDNPCSILCVTGDSALAGSASSEMAPLRECEADADHPDAEARIRRGLTSGNNRVVELAARLAGEQQRKSLVAELRAAYERCLKNVKQTDPGCLAKTAIVDALRLMEYDDDQFFLTNIRYRQYEPGWGGETDSAARLRAICGFALIQQSHPEAMSELVDLLADPEKTARAGAARAVAHGGSTESEHLLRLKISLGDTAPEVMGECLSGLLRLNAKTNLNRVARFLENPSEELASEAAIALGESRLPEALTALDRQLQRTTSTDLARSLLTAIGLVGSCEASECLLRAVIRGDYDRAVAAIDALAHCGDRDEVKRKLLEIASQPQNARLKNVVASAFGK
jgi:HEAT repeat protein